MRRVLALVVLLFGTSASILADHQRYQSSSSGYYFRPPRTLFYLRPDFLFQPKYGYGYGYGHRYHYYPGYAGYGRAWLRDPGLWTQGQRGTYSTYLQRPARMPIVRTNTSDLIFNVTPSTAVVYLNGKRIGTAGEMATERDRYMVLDGRHELRVEYPGYKPFRADLNIEPDRTIRLDVKLDPLNGR
jgi:hypothetical protein